MVKTISWDTVYNRIIASSNDSNDPLTFEDIWQYFQDNPLDETFEFPRDTLICSENELCEENADDWVPLNGFDNPADDGVNYTHNNYSISAEVLSVPIPDTSATKIKRVLADLIYVYMPNTSAYSTNEHIRITGTTNFNGIYLIKAISTNSYIALRVPKSVDDLAPVTIDDPVEENSLTILKPLSLIWNDDRAIQRVIGISQCQTIKFSLKTDSVEASPKCVGIALRNIYSPTSENTEPRCFYGASLLKDFDLTSVWQDFEIIIKDEFNLSYWGSGNVSIASRGYWFNLGKVAFFFDGLAVGDTVWLDGVRFNSNRNPTKPYKHGTTYKFPIGLYITGYFKDFGFNFILDCLESPCSRHDGGGLLSTNSISFIATNTGDIELGDYSGSFIAKDGGIFFVDNFSSEDTGSMAFTKTQLQGITFRGNKGIEAIGGLLLTTSYFKNCIFQKMLDINTSACELTDCNWFGGRYFSRTSGVGFVVNNVTVIGTMGQVIFSRQTTAYKEMTGLKVINQNLVLYSDNYSSSETNIYGYRLIDLDVSECTNPYVQVRVTGGVGFKTYHQIAYSMNFKLIDELGSPIENATIELKNNVGDVVFTETTDNNGEIAEQIVDALTIYNDGSVDKSYYLNTPDVDWIKQYPFNLKISKSGYETYTESFSPTKLIDWTITLKTAKDIVISNRGVGIKLDPTNSTDDRDFVIMP